MGNVFAQALSVIFADPNMGEDAMYWPGGTGPVIALRVLMRAPDVADQFGETRAIVPTHIIEVRQIDVELPAEGDAIDIGNTIYKVWGDPIADQLRQIWQLSASVVA